MPEEFRVLKRGNDRTGMPAHAENVEMRWSETMISPYLKLPLREEAEARREIQTTTESGALITSGHSQRYVTATLELTRHDNLNLGPAILSDDRWLP